jgi:hypothetical protein
VAHVALKRDVMALSELTVHWRRFLGGGYGKGEQNMTRQGVRGRDVLWHMGGVFLARVASN